MKKWILVCLCIAVVFNSRGQVADSTYAEKLGFPKGSKVVILHVDDAGMSYDSNQGAITALTKGVATLGLTQACTLRLQLNGVITVGGL